MKPATRGKSLPKTLSVYEAQDGHNPPFLYENAIEHILKRTFPEQLLGKPVSHALLRTSLPVIAFSNLVKVPFNFSVYTFSKFRENIGVFILEMISKWLIPGKRSNALFFFATDIIFPDLDKQKYTVAEVGVSISNQHDLEVVKRNYRAIKKELGIGISSAYHAYRILEMKGLAVSEKTALIQEQITYLIHRFPKRFDYDIFSDMQRFLITTHSSFKRVRECRYMTRIICALYLFQKLLSKQVEDDAKTRHLIVKLIRARLQLPLGIKPVLGIFIGLNFLRENEVFSKKQIIKAIKSMIPSAGPVEDAYFVSKNKENTIHTIYIEIEKEGGAELNTQEIAILREGLSGNLKGWIEHLLRPIFMPRNEEEVMKNMITLSHQLKYVKDIPQVIIAFDEQTDKDLSFTIVLVRVLFDNSLSIKDLFLRKGPPLRFFPDRIKKIGLIRKKYPKEATVFQVKMTSNTFIREDHSLDLYQARKFILAELQRVVGEVRDYNGGMLLKQNENYDLLKEFLGESGKQHSFLLENFFHSIFPIEHRSMLHPKYLKKLFMMLVRHVNEKTIGKRDANLEHLYYDHRLFVLMAFQNLGLKQQIVDNVNHLKILSSELIMLHLQLSEVVFLGYVYTSDGNVKHNDLLKIFTESIDK